MKKNSIAPALSLMLAAAAGPVLAQQAAEPAGIPMGPMTAFPALDVTVKHDDNIYSARDKQGSGVSVIAPSVRLGAKTGPDEYGLTARIEDGRFFSSSADNYTDYRLGADASWVFSGRAGFKARADYFKSHDPRGSVVGAAIGSTPDEYHTSGVGGIFTYGAEGAQGRLEIDAGYISKKYDNNRFVSQTVGTRFTDHDDSRFGGTFYWRVMPKTQVLIQAGETRYDYTDAYFDAAGLPARDSTERRYLVGVTWEPSEITSGIFKIGSVSKDYSNPTIQDFSSASWDGTIRWKPLSYSSFELTLSQKPNESTLGSATVDRTTSLLWRHTWSERVSSSLSYANTRSEYKGLSVGRSDTVDVYGASVSYQMQRWLKLGAGYEHTDRSSTDPTATYNRNVFSLFMAGAL